MTPCADSTRETAPEERVAVECLSMAAVMTGRAPARLRAQGRGAERIGYDIESHENNASRLRLIEIKGRAEGADTVVVTRNEVLTALDKPGTFILAIVEVANRVTGAPRYVRGPFVREPDFGVTSVTHGPSELLARARPSD